MAVDRSDYIRLIPQLKNPVALDIDVANNMIFWSDMSLKKIFRLEAFLHFVHLFVDGLVQNLSVMLVKHQSTCIYNPVLNLAWGQSRLTKKLYC